MTTGFIAQGSEFLVNTNTVGDQLNAALTSLAGGGYVVTWEADDLSGNLTDVFGQMYDNSGNTIGGAFKINSHTGHHQKDSAVTSLGDGGFLVTWTSGDQDGDGWGVFGQRFDSAGASVGTEFQINNYTTNYQQNSDVTSLADGGVIVVWNSYFQDGSYDGVYGQRFDANGALVGSELKVSTETVYGQLNPSVAPLLDGGFVVTWMSNYQDSSHYGIYGQRYGADGLKAGAEFQINTEVVSDQRDAEVTSLTGGGFVVTWQSYAQDWDQDGVYAQRFDASGNMVGTEFLVNTRYADFQNTADISATADGGFIIIWQSNRQTSKKLDVMGQRYDADGVTVGGEFKINTYTLDRQENATITTLKDGGFVVSWESDGQDADGYGIYAQQFAAQLFGTSSSNTVKDTIGANWIDGQGGGDVLYGYGGRDKIYGSGGNDVLNGGAGKDKLYGGTGDDTLNGGSKDDTLKGQGGSDTLIGGAGKDTLTGGAGADKFVFNAVSDSVYGARGDVVTDFKVGVDLIDLSAFGVGFIGANGFSGAAEVRAITKGSDTVVRVDVDGDGSGDMTILLEGVAGLTASDFLL